jgi:hypothetical protein
MFQRPELPPSVSKHVTYTWQNGLFAPAVYGTVHNEGFEYWDRDYPEVITRKIGRKPL